MSFMKLQVVQLGALSYCDCAKCGTTLYSHEWVHDDHNDRRDAMQAGTLLCDDCPGKARAETFREAPRKQYAARFSAPGYMDVTDWHYGSNRRALEKEVRDMYGEPAERDPVTGRFVSA